MAPAVIRAVCKTWRSSLSHHSSTSFPPNLPFPMLPNPHLNPHRQGHFSLSHSILYLLQPPSSASTSLFFLRLQEDTINNKYHPINPLSEYSAERVPPVSSFPSSLNLLDDDIRVSEIVHAYNLDYVDVSRTGTRFTAANYLESQSIIVNQTAVGNGIVVAVIGGQLGFFRLGIDLKWTPIDSKNDTYHDVVYRSGSGRFYAVDYCGRTVAIGGDKAAEVEVIVESGLPEMGACQFTRLVEGDGDELFLVYRYLDSEEDDCVIFRQAVTWGMETEQEHWEMPSYFHVYRLSESDKKWERVVVGLGDDRVFLIGDDYSVLVSARDYPALKGGCIYFSDTMCYEKNDKEAGIAKSCVLTWVHDLKDGRTGPLADFPDHWPAFSPLPTWLGTPPPDEMLLQRDASNPKQDVPELTTEAKKKAAEAKLRGDDAFRRQDYLMALDAYKQAIDFNPTDATLLSNRSLCWIRMGQAEHALADAKACRALKPNWSKACYREGHALQLLEKFEEAADAFYEGLMLDPENKDILHAYREVAEALEKRKLL
ncbi:hypothetical protein Vadar_013681 [Vaccinium darrowii]|uniref:Uncharacterized protein n=1 Tax=Vaccinium darrowii TaxID=229202 RepID=A0ACB7XAK1_9ERIC|nr:hypothetical protein Vadar_013681 [Vaccinium darrowii]